MNIVVCVKLTPDPGDIEVLSDRSISLERAEWVIGSFDLQAIEAGVQLVEADGGKVTVLSAGPPRANNSKLKKDILSRGPDELVMVIDDLLKDAGTAQTARVLARAIGEIGAVDLVLCGEGSADLYFQQVGIQVGERLGWPALNAISKIDRLDGSLLVERNLEDEVEVLEVALPAVLAVTTDIHQARLPTMKEILKSSKKPVLEWTLADLQSEASAGAAPEVVSVRAPEQVERKQIRVEGPANEAARALVAHLAKEGVL